MESSSCTIREDRTNAQGREDHGYCSYFSEEREIVQWSVDLSGLTSVVARSLEIMAPTGALREGTSLSDENGCCSYFSE